MKVWQKMVRDFYIQRLLYSCERATKIALNARTTRKLTEKEATQIAQLFCEECLPGPKIRDILHLPVSNRGMIHYIKLMGLGYPRSWQLHCICPVCGRQYTTNRYFISHGKKYCSIGCYHQRLRDNAIGEFLSGSNKTMGSRRARQVVTEIVDTSEWPPSWVIHHEDGNQLNNEPHNLKAFRDQGDHLRYHREVPNITPLWSGADVV